MKGASEDHATTSIRLRAERGEEKTDVAAQTSSDVEETDGDSQQDLPHPGLFFF